MRIIKYLGIFGVFAVCALVMITKARTVLVSMQKEKMISEERNETEIEGKTEQDISSKKTELIDDAENTPIETTLDNQEIWKEIVYQEAKMEEMPIYDVGEKALQDHWYYTVKSAVITKKFQQKWDFVPEDAEVKFDKRGNIKNKFSYIVVTMELEAKSDAENYLNSLCLRIFNRKGERVGSGLTDVTTLGKLESRDYFQLFLKAKEKKVVECIYLMKDEVLKENYFYFIEINNRGALPTDPSHVSFLKLPLGVEFGKGEEDDH